jgi:hypothetical protein
VDMAFWHLENISQIFNAIIRVYVEELKMTKLNNLLATCLVTLLVGNLLSSTAMADDPTWSINSLQEFGCNSGEMTWSVTFSGATGLTVETLATANDVLYMNEEFIFNEGDVTTSWRLYDNNSGGPIEGIWPLPQNAPISVQFSLKDDIDGTVVFTTSTEVLRCNPPAIPAIPATNSWGLLIGILGLGLIGGLWLCRATI